MQHNIVLMLTAYAASLCRTAVAFTPPSLLKRNAFQTATAAATTSRIYMSTNTDANTDETSTSTSTSTSTEALINGRISIGSLTSLDSRTIIDNLELVLTHLQSRRASSTTLSAAQQIHDRNDERVSLIQQRDSALQTRNEESKKIGMLMRNKDKEKEGNEGSVLGLVEQAKSLSAAAADDAAAAEEKLSKLEQEVEALLASLPNLLDDNVPDGVDDTDNVRVEEWGDIRALPSKLGWPTDDSFEPKWHDDVASGLNGWQAERAVAMSGARFVALSGHIARLDRAISTFFLDLHVDQHGYTEVSVPLVVGRSALEGTSQLPKFEDDLFKITQESHQCNGEDAFLIPTAEVPLTNMHRDSILEEAELPISYVALTPCFRAEAGSYGRDTRGLIRTHQFSKVEMVKIATKDTSMDLHEELTRHAQACLEALELPYRKVRLCSGDIGFSARHCYDLEVWLPGSQEFREISSCSNTGDFQAKRMGLRYRPVAKEEPAQGKGDGDGDGDANKGGKKKKKKAKKPKPVFCHTINGSGLAVGRTLLAVLENYQMPDGSVVVPEVLRPYMGGAEVLKV